MKAAVIGAGISGPAAALGLANSGWDVTVQERRSPNDLWSDSTVAITTENIQALEKLGVTVPMLPAGSRSIEVSVDTFERTHCTPQEWTTKFNIVVWGQLHEALVEAGQAAGVKYDWRANGEIPPADLVVHGQGVRYAAHHSEFDYAYRVYRGTNFQDAEPMWVSMHTKSKAFVLNIGSTGTQQTWMLYIHEPEGNLFTELIVGDRRDYLMRRAESLIPEPWASVVTGTRTEIQASPVGDWTMPKMVQWLGKDYDDPKHVHHVDIGDAIVPVRPHTTAGANLGIKEGLGLANGWFDLWEAETRLNREREIQNGKDLGMKWMGR